MAFIEEVLLDGTIDTLKLVPFLFLTYLLMEFIEHRASDKTERFLKKAEFFGPVIGGLLGALPQCGFSSSAAGLFTGRVISAGTLIAVFLATSDEMLPILLAGNLGAGSILTILGYKVAVGIVVGLAVDLLLRLFRHKPEKMDIDEICENDNCHCERGILHSAVHHTLTVSLFVLVITFALNTLIFFVGDDRLAAIGTSLPLVSHALAAVFGLIPNCAASVVLTKLCLDGVITSGAMLSGLFSGAGVGLLVLLKQNKHPKQNAAILAVLLLAGFAFGLLADLLGIQIVA